MYTAEISATSFDDASHATYATADDVARNAGSGGQMEARQTVTSAWWMLHASCKAVVAASSAGLMR